MVGQLLEFNSHEFSLLTAENHNGRYEYQYLDAYWSESGRVSYLLRAGGELAGLVLARRVDAVMSVAEFLVLPKFRRTGVGTQAARRCLGIRSWQEAFSDPTSAALRRWSSRETASHCAGRAG